MPIWIKSGNSDSSLVLCGYFYCLRQGITDKYSVHIYAFPYSGNSDSVIQIHDLTEQQAKDLMCEISVVAASGGTYYEIAERNKP